MNFLRKALASDTKIPKSNHGKAFTNKERQYYELERMLRKLLVDVKRYCQLLGELLSCKTSIYGYLLYFYNQKSEKRTIIDDLFKYHTRPMEKYINKLSEEYQNNLIDEIQQILKVFPDTRQMISTLSLKKQQYLSRKQYYQQLKESNQKIDYNELSTIDEQVRICEHTYDFSVRTVIREFEQKVDRKDAILDRFATRMLESDSKLYSHLFKTSRVLREKSLMFQYYRDYPSGLPSYFRDYSYKQDIQSSSDSDINASKANIFYENTIKNNNITQENKNNKLINQLTQHGFEYETVQMLITKYPNHTYEQLLEMLNKKDEPIKQSVDNINDTITMVFEPPPASQNIHKKPKAPNKQTELTDINIELDTDIIPNNINNTNSMSMSDMKSQINTRPQRTHSKSVSSPVLHEWKETHKIHTHRTPPAPPRAGTVDLINISKPKPPPIASRMSVSSSVDIIENKNDYDDINEDEWSMPIPHIHDDLESDNEINTPEYILNPPTLISSVNKKKNYIEIKNLLQNNNGVRAWVWNKTNVGNEGLYRYSRPTNKLEEDNKHPLGCGIHTMLNFNHMHQLFHPKQTKHIGDPNSNVIPNKVHINDVVVRNVNIRKITLDVNKLDPKIQSWIYSKGKKDIIKHIPKPGNVKTGNIPLNIPRKMSMQQRKGNKPPPTQPKDDTPPPPSPPLKQNTND